MGFSIDAALVRLTLGKRFAADRVKTINACNIWLRKKTIIRIIATLNVIPTAGMSGLSLVVWTLKCEVRAFGECLGIQRR